ncbi:MAG: aminotransferase class I/II-fold pyridoxal phosphate-dependent enzyme, partial [Fusobacterium sp.]
MHISQRASTMNYSPIRKLIPLADAAKAQGVTVYALNIGQPNIVTPDTFFTALHSFSDKIVKYSDSRGLEKLRESFKASYEKMDTFFDKEEILITQGGSEAIFFTMMAICNEGDNVLIPEPFYSNYSSFCKFAGAVVKPIETTIETKFHLPSREVIENLIDEKTRAIMISNPVNPTGAVYTKEDFYRVVGVGGMVARDFIGDEVVNLLLDGGDEN